MKEPEISSANAAGAATTLLPVPQPKGRPRRRPLRAVGVGCASGVIVLVMALVASALIFRDTVESHLAGIEQVQARQAALVNAAAKGDAASRRQEYEREAAHARIETAKHLADARKDSRAAVVAITCLALFGIAVMSALAMMFFSRLVTDIRLVRARALAIVEGNRSRGSPLIRNDELGDLSAALDTMAEALALHERELEIERRHVMHQEKLATIGAMAAGVVRAIGNPIAAIDGYARGLMSRQGGGAGDTGVATDILRETDRLIAAIHEISALAAPPAAQPQLASLNDIVSQSIALLRFEPRLEGVTITTSLDPQLPALVAVADRLVLLTTSLIINAADATAGRGPRGARIDVSTRSAVAGVELCVSDNGCGMSRAVLERAFEPLFTTKPAGRGTGLGLPLARSIAVEHGGDITLQSSPGQGTLVRVWLSLRSL